MSPFEALDEPALLDILISFDCDEITFSAENARADRWMRRASPGRLDPRYDGIISHARVTFCTPKDDGDAKAFKEEALRQGFRFS